MTDPKETPAPILAAIEPQAVAEPAGDAETVVGMAAGILCETGTLCGWPAPNCKANEGAEALFKAGLLSVAPPASNSSGDGADEQEIDRLRLQAFKTNSAEDRSAYFNAVSKWFQDRHYRRMAQPVTASDERAAEALRVALTSAADTLEGLSYIHDGNPSDALADMDPVEYARHMLFEARQMAKAARSEALAALAAAPKAQPVQGIHPDGAKQTIIQEVWEHLEGPHGLRRNIDRSIIAQGVETALHVLRTNGITLSAKEG